MTPDKDMTVAGTQQTVESPSRCTLCPAGCELNLFAAAVDTMRIEYPLQPSTGLCARGASLGELSGHHRRIFSAYRRSQGKLQPVGLDGAIESLLAAGGDRPIMLLLDGNLPLEQLVVSAEWCAAWPQARLCLVVESADEQLVSGIESAGVDYLSNEDLSGCDGFVVVGDAFAADPACSRGVFDRRATEARTPIIAIDPGFGSTAKFATHVIPTPPGLELAALSALAAEMGVEGVVAGASNMPGVAISFARQAAGALGRCKRLGVLVSAEYGRTDAWWHIGRAAAMLAKARGGGVSPQTAGAGVLGAVRLAERLETTPLAGAIDDDGRVRVAVGSDPLGMLGRDDIEISAAAGALPNATTDRAEWVLPVCLPAELGGSYLFAGAARRGVSPLIAPPAGVPTPSELVAAMARRAGITRPAELDIDSLIQPSRAQRARPAPTYEDPPGPVLLLGRNSRRDGCGTLTALASWQAAALEPELRVSAQDAREMGLTNLSPVDVSAGASSVRARVRISPELCDGVVVLSDGHADCRRLIPREIDRDTATVFARPATAKVSHVRADK